MNLLNKLERPLGWMAVGNLPIYVVAAQAILYLWGLAYPGQEHLLTMEPSRVMAGEWWRVLTFLFLVPFQNVLFTALYLYFQFVCGQALENEWGSFRLTMYYLLGAAGCIVGAFVAGTDLQSAFYLNETIFLAFAALYPDFRILLFFIIPVKIKWIAWFAWARILLVIFYAPWIFKLAVLISLSNYFFFFSKTHVESVTAWVRLRAHRRRFKDFQS